MNNWPRSVGKVMLVGAGPGDPELITLKGLRALKEADVVVYDRLVDSRLLQEAPAEAERIFVGKKGGHYSVPQDRIHELLADRAGRGLSVVRLKGGDPFLFGRGGEEALFLKDRGIPFEVVPGVSSALAAPGAAGIPVTHRGLSSSVVILSGHQAGDARNPVDWRRLSSAADTIVVLMPLQNLRFVVAQAVLNGRSLTTPAAVVQSATCADQKSVYSSLREIADRVEEAGIESPAILIIGEVARLGPALGGEQASLSGGQPGMDSARTTMGHREERPASAIGGAGVSVW